MGGRRGLREPLGPKVGVDAVESRRPKVVGKMSSVHRKTNEEPGFGWMPKAESPIPLFGLYLVGVVSVE